MDAAQGQLQTASLKILPSDFVRLSFVHNFSSVAHEHATFSGLDYLHNACVPPIIHGNLKPTNILLNENYQAKLVDFGLSKIFTTQNGSTEFLDPE